LKKGSVTDHPAFDHNYRNADGASALTRAGIGGPPYLCYPYQESSLALPMTGLEI
jgi:hypothetical protein